MSDPRKYSESAHNPAQQNRAPVSKDMEAEAKEPRPTLPKNLNSLLLPILKQR